MKWTALLVLLTTLSHPTNTKSFTSRLPSEEERLWAHIDYRARHYGFSTELIHRIIEEESAWNTNAISPKKAYGLMQVLLPTARDILRDSSVTREELLSNPFLNVEAGIRYLSWLMERFDGDLKLSLAAYNRGIGRVKKDLANGKNPINAYTKRVLNSK